jgi:aspartate dehydrogenase
MSSNTRIALGGFGNVATQLTRAILGDPDSGMEITAITAGNLAAAAERATKLGLDVPVVPAHALSDHADVIVECATYESFRDILEPAIMAGRHVIAVSVGALAVNFDLVDLAKQHGATLHIATGAMPGLDILRSAREGTIEYVRLESHIRPGSFAHEEYVIEKGVDLVAAETGPVPVFSGSAREAASHFPRHFNVAVALSLAGIGLDRTEIEIFANGTLPGARHTVRVKSDVVDLEMTSQNYPSPDNQRTSRGVAPSILAALRELNTHLRIGS